jgi:signal peptidase II
MKKAPPMEPSRETTASWKFSWWIYILIAATVFLLDQLTKNWIHQSLFPGEAIVVIPHFFQIVSVRNTGIVFGMFQGDGENLHRMILVGVTVAAAAGIIYYSSRRRRERGFEFLPLALVLGGALGNLSDRVLGGRVVDFLDFQVAGHHWPAFNIADSAIVIGVSLLVGLGLFPTPSGTSPESSPGKPQNPGNTTH